MIGNLFGGFVYALFPLKTLLYFLKREREILFRNIHRVYQLPEQSSFAQNFALQVFRHKLWSFIELCEFLYRPESFTIHGIDEFSMLMQQTEKHANSGQIFITAHLGNWEILGGCCARVCQKQFYALAKPAKYASFTLLINWIRRKLNLTEINSTSKNVQKEMLKAMQHGDWLAFVMDQKPKGRVGPKLEFTGFPTEWVTGPQTLAMKKDAPVVAGFCVREGRRTYRLYTKLLLPIHHQETDLLKVSKIFVEEIERWVKLYPEQWTWDYKRWKVFHEIQTSPS